MYKEVEQKSSYSISQQHNEEDIEAKPIQQDNNQYLSENNNVNTLVIKDPHYQPKHYNFTMNLSWPYQILLFDLIEMLRHYKNLFQTFKCIQIEDLPLQVDMDQANYGCNRFNQKLQEKDIDQLTPQQLFIITCKVYSLNTFLCFLTVGLYICIKFCNSILIKCLLNAIETNNDHTKFIYAIITSICLIFSCITVHLGDKYCYAIIVRIRIMIMMVLYKKINGLSFFSIKQASIGKLVNLLSNDFTFVETKIYCMISTAYLPFSLLFGSIILVQRFGYLGLISVICLVLFIPMQSVLSQKFIKKTKERTQANDIRVKACGEMIQGIRLIKMYAWETAFEKQLGKLRYNELKLAFEAQLWQYINYILNFSSLIIVSFIQFAVIYFFDGGTLTFDNIFSTLELFNTIKQQIVWSGIGIFCYKDILVIMQRALDILKIKNITTNEVEESPSQYQDLNSAHLGIAIQLTDFNAFWTEKRQDTDQQQKQIQKPVLSNINLSIQRGQIVAIIGLVGSGKSSLLFSIVKEVPYFQGQLHVNGKIAYVEQDPYIFSGTVKDNILFGNEFDQNLYQQVIVNCCLEQDLQTLPNWDQSEIGEKGSTISGGQKLRISLARAVYSQADIYLLDDPLSAVDSKVALKLFENVIKGMLRGKTVVMVTHQIFYAKQADKIIILDEGQIAAQGNYEELEIEIFRRSGQQNQIQMLKNIEQSPIKGNYANDLRAKYLIDNSPPAQKSVQEASQEVKQEGEEQNGASTDNEGDQEDTNNSNNANIAKSEEEVESDRSDDKFKIMNQAIQLKKDVSIEQKHILLDQEEDQQIVLSNQSYFRYYSASKYKILWIVVFLSYLFTQIIYIQYCNQLGLIEKSEQKDLIIIALGILTLLFVISSMVQDFSLLIQHLTAVYNIHQNMIKGILRSKTSFFDYIPSGKILNNFSNDTGYMDSQLFTCQTDVYERLSFFVINVSAIIIIYNWFIIIIAIEIYIMLQVYSYSKGLIIETRKLDLRHRTPLYTFFNTTLNGILPIRIYKQSENFFKHFTELSNNNYRISLSFFLISRAFGYILNLLGSITAVLGIWYAVLFDKSQDGQVNVGKIIVYLISTAECIQWGIRQRINFDVAMNSAQRNFSLIDLEPEADLTQKGDELLKIKKFPQNGEIKFQNVQLRYHKDQDTVLNGVNFIINPKQKVGCVGRTGAGKSSLILSILRMYEIEDNNESSIYIDDVNIKSCGLKLLRDSIAVIPQFPFLFSGTIKQNLDPLEQYQIDELWKVLEQVDLKQFVEKMPKGLHSDMTHAESLFSYGQKQLICLARAMLKKSKILLLDEATANIDMKTDLFIQKKIKQIFVDSTVFVIAHRLYTIADYDKVLVMDKGKVAEFEKPINLLSTDPHNDQTITKDSIFSQMVKQLGHKSSQLIFKVAKNKFEQDNNK